MLQLVQRSLFLFAALSNALARQDDTALIRSTTSGKVLGYLDSQTVPDVPLTKWLGIRYASDTSGPNRWRSPQPVQHSHELFNATVYGPACLQGRCVLTSYFKTFQCLHRGYYSADGGNGTAIQSEDCLRINIIAPANAAGLPVYLYSQ